MIKVYNLQAVQCAEFGCTATILKGRVYCARHGGPERARREELKAKRSVEERARSARREAWNQRNAEFEARLICERLATAIRMAAICAVKEREAARAKRAAAQEAMKKALELTVHYDSRGRLVGGGLGTSARRALLRAEADRLLDEARTHTHV